MAGGVHGRRGHVWLGGMRATHAPLPPIDTKATAYGQ